MKWARSAREDTKKAVSILAIGTARIETRNFRLRPDADGPSRRKPGAPKNGKHRPRSFASGNRSLPGPRTDCQKLRYCKFRVIFKLGNYVLAATSGVERPSRHNWRSRTTRKRPRAPLRFGPFCPCRVTESCGRSCLACQKSFKQCLKFKV